MTKSYTELLFLEHGVRYVNIIATSHRTQHHKQGNTTKSHTTRKETIIHKRTSHIPIHRSVWIITKTIKIRGTAIVFPCAHLGHIQAPWKCREMWRTHESFGMFQKQSADVSLPGHMRGSTWNVSPLRTLNLFPFVFHHEAISICFRSVEVT